jgi:hypothetical protein
MLLPSKAFFAEEAVSVSENCTSACKDQHRMSSGSQKKKETNSKIDENSVDLKSSCLLKSSNLMHKTKS